jgi:hypothetical protein
MSRRGKRNRHGKHKNKYEHKQQQQAQQQKQENAQQNNNNQQSNRKQKKSKKQKNVSYAHREIVSAGEWKRFVKFKEYHKQLEEAVIDIQEHWNIHVEEVCNQLADIPKEMENIQDTLVRLNDLIKGLEYDTRKAKRPSYYEQKQYDSSDNYVSNRPKQKYEESSHWLAEIIIEDISDGKL